ncbi:MAG: hypothetical protein ACI4XF_10010 [Oscillospiraceae bacterium]
MANSLKKKSSGEKSLPSIGLPKKTSMLVFVITIVLAAALRFQQLLTNVNFNTGRYIDDSFAKNYPVMVIILGLILMAAVLVLGVASDKVVDECILINPWRLRYDRLNKKMPSAAGYSSMLMCLLLLLDGGMKIAQTVSRNMEIRDAILDEKEAKNYSLLTGFGVWDWIEIVLMLMVFAIFLTMAMNIFKKEGISRANCAALTIFAAWKVLDIFKMFSGNTVIAVSSEKVYELITDMAAVVFFLAVSRLFMGMEKKSTRFWVCMWGYFTSIIAAVSVLPRYATLFVPTGYDDRLGMGMPSISDIGLIFLPVCIVAVFWTGYSYREMPKGIAKEKRWTLNARPKDTDMDNLDVDGVDTDTI